MKCHKPGTDQEAEFYVLVNDAKAVEFSLPSPDSEDPNILECIIAVDVGDELTIQGSFSGSMLHATFDVCADGALVGGHRIEGKDGVSKVWKGKKYAYDQFYDNPKPKGWPSVYEPTGIVECSLHPKILSDEDAEHFSKCEILGPTTSRTGFGALTVIISLSQDSTHTYQHDYFNKRLGSWRERTNDAVRGCGIPPQHELEPRVTNSSIGNKRSAKHKRHFDQTRYGEKPWARFIFYYRSLQAVQEAKCPRRGDAIQWLEAAKPGSFVASQQIAWPGGTKSKRKLQKDIEIAGSDCVDSFASPLSSNDLTTYSDPSKKPRLGGLLVLQKQSPDSISKISTADQQPDSPSSVGMRTYGDESKQPNTTPRSGQYGKVSIHDSGVGALQPTKGENLAQNMLGRPYGQASRLRGFHKNSPSRSQYFRNASSLGCPTQVDHQGNNPTLNSSSAVLAYLPKTTVASAAVHELQQGQALISYTPSAKCSTVSQFLRRASRTSPSRQGVADANQSSPSERKKRIALLQQSNEEKRARAKLLEEQKKSKLESMERKQEEARRREEYQLAELERLERENADYDAQLAQLEKDILEMASPSSLSDGG